MTPGRELDALVAERVMGCKLRWRSPTQPGCDCSMTRPHGEPVDGESNDWPLRAYSTEIAAAWEVVERVGRNFALEQLHPGRGDAWWVGFSRNGEPASMTFFCDQANGSTAPHAICLAALAAVGAEVTPQEV